MRLQDFILFVQTSHFKLLSSLQIIPSFRHTRHHHLSPKLAHATRHSAPLPQGSNFRFAEPIIDDLDLGTSRHIDAFNGSATARASHLAGNCRAADAKLSCQPLPIGLDQPRRRIDPPRQGVQNLIAKIKRQPRRPSPRGSRRTMFHLIRSFFSPTNKTSALYHKIRPTQTPSTRHPGTTQFPRVSKFPSKDVKIPRHGSQNSPPRVSKSPSSTYDRRRQPPTIAIPGTTIFRPKLARSV